MSGKQLSSNYWITKLRQLDKILDYCKKGTRAALVAIDL